MAGLAKVKLRINGGGTGCSSSVVSVRVVDFVRVLVEAVDETESDISSRKEILLTVLLGERHAIGAGRVVENAWSLASRVREREPAA